MTTRQELNKDKHNRIETEKNKVRKKKLTVLVFKVIFFSIVFITILFFYITYVANLHTVVREYRINSNKIPDSFNGVKIVQFSDIHFGTTIGNKELNTVIKLINSRKPDIVVFTGDLIDKNYKLSSIEQEKIINSFKKINSSIGKYAAIGDEDKEAFSTIFNQSDFTILNNSYDLVYKDNNDPILIVGLNKTINTDTDEAYKYFSEANHNSKIYTISLVHEPDFIDEIQSKYNNDLFLAGHSHNGQIRIPYLGTIPTKKGARKYYNEHYKLNKADLYVSSGIGTNGSGIRLFTHPSINLFRLSNKF
ncbi:MAG: metallophosphoesterase [Bacilli bacterium]|nr:metallophosphoesterase [Bacilli bacterium]